MTMELMWIVLAYIVVGFAAGVSSGLLGFGGGFMVVPLLYWSFHLLHIPHEVRMHLAVGSSLLVMVVSALNSVSKHNKKGGVNWDVFKRTAPFVVFGTATSALLLSYLSTKNLHYLFLIYMLGSLLHSVVFKSFKEISEEHQPKVPSLPQSGVFGFLLGLVATTLGVGGSVISIPYLRKKHFRMAGAVGTALSFTLPISIVGAVGCMLAGYHGGAALPPYSIGFVYIPAVLGLTLGNLFGVPVGVKYAHALPDRHTARAYLMVLALFAIVTALEH